MAGGIGSIVSVAGPATMIGLIYSPVGRGVGPPFTVATGCRIVAVSTGAKIGVGVGFGVLAITVSAQVLLLGFTKQTPPDRGFA